MEAKPLQIVSSSHNNNSGGGPQMKIQGGVVDEEKKRENSSPNVELDIGVGASSEAPQEEAINPVIKACHQKYCLFSEAQRRELDHQLFIFNQFAHNLHLPLQFPSHMSEYSGLGFDYGTMVDDPEPHRCRRTDGKKWRCSKNTVPHQKYCERHMHRGRNRSRKPVETSSQVNSPLTTKPCGNKSHAKPAPNTKSAVSSPNIVTIHDTPSTQSRSFCVANTSSVNSRSRNAVGSSDYQTPFSPAVVVTPGSTLATAIAPKVTTFSSMASVTSHYRSHVNVHTKDEQNMSCIISNKMSIKSSGKGSIVCDSISNGISTGIGVSPRSVLQGNHSYLTGRNNIESEAGRCRRTDGKKWQCKGGVLPGQKYCATHMHRGAKKRFTDQEPATTLSVNTARLPYPSATTNVQKAPNTNLSMSVPASAAAAFTECNEKSASSSDTDTTISDTINECNYLSF